MTLDEVMKVITYNGFNVTFTGGDPLYSVESILPLARQIAEAGYTIWCYTGFTWEELMENGTPAQKEFLKYVEVLVDGPYLAARRNTTLRFRGSDNQRMIKVAPTLISGQITLFQ